MSQENERYVIADLLFQTNKTYAEIAIEIGKHETYVSAIIKEMGYDWVRRKSRKMSRGASSLTHIFNELIPGEKIVNEFHVGERLMLDVYCPAYKIAAEYHGRQHFFFNTMFHESNRDFVEGQLRDERKLELCKEQGIAVISFRYNDNLNEDVVHNRIVEALRDSSNFDKKIKRKVEPKSAYYEEQQQRRRLHWRRQYKKMKEIKKRDSI
jgi:hypothetical protein